MDRETLDCCKWRMMMRATANGRGRRMLETCWCARSCSGFMSSHFSFLSMTKKICQNVTEKIRIPSFTGTRKHVRDPNPVRESVIPHIAMSYLSIDDLICLEKNARGQCRAESTSHAKLLLLLLIDPPMRTSQLIGGPFHAPCVLEQDFESQVQKEQEDTCRHKKELFHRHCFLVVFITSGIRAGVVLMQ